MKEVGVTMAAWEHRAKRYGEEESVVRSRAVEVGIETATFGNPLGPRLRRNTRNQRIMTRCQLSLRKETQ